MISGSRVRSSVWLVWPGLLFGRGLGSRRVAFWEPPGHSPWSRLLHLAAMPPAKRRGNVAKTSGAMKYVQEPRKPNKRALLSLAASGSSGDVRGSSSYSVRDATEDDAEAISALCVRTSALHSLLAALDADMRRWVLQREIGVGAIVMRY